MRHLFFRQINVFTLGGIVIALNVIVLGVVKVETRTYSYDDKEAFSVHAPFFNLPIFDTGIAHIETPTSVRGVYMSAWVASDVRARSRIISFIDRSEINTLVTDIKDATGTLSFTPDTLSPRISSVDSSTQKIRDISEFIEELHKRDIYVIGRVSVFQDPVYAQKFPDQAVQSIANKRPWQDRKGLPWVDPGSTDFWAYIRDVATMAYAIGFDEINFDYIRYPSDGNMADVSYPHSGDRERTDVMKEFYAFLQGEVGKEGIPISADLFGMTTTNKDDLGIGQILEDALPYFDAISPMVYPSHYPANYLGFKNPSEHPYDVIRHTMQSAVDSAHRVSENPLKLRPWLQDFNLGATYTPAMVRQQIQATYDVGLESWLMWDASNTYTESAYQTQPTALPIDG